MSTRKIIENLVLTYLYKHKIKKESSIIVAFSGGPDSTVLLTILSGLKDWNLNLIAAHFNHGLRPEVDLAAEELVIRRQAERLGIEIIVAVEQPGKIKKSASSQGLSVEEAARNARYNFLYKTRLEHDADYIATGHNLNDNSETLLMRFFQNSGIAGLVGIPEKRNEVIRPLFRVSRQLIEVFIAEERLECSLDKTNLENEYLRNKLRLDIIPVIKDVFPEFDRNMAGVSNKMKLYNDFIESESEKRLVWHPSERGWKILAVDFYAEPELLRIRSIYRILNLVSSLKRIRYGAVEQAASERVYENGKILLKLSDAEVSTANDFIFIDILVNREKNSYLLGLEAGVRVEACGQSFMIIEPGFNRQSPGNKSEQCIRLLTDFPLIVRSYREGDSIETEVGRKSLKKIFNEWKIKSEDKYRVPVVENSSRILAVIGKHLGYDNKKAPLTQNEEGSLSKILLMINSDTETTGE